MKGAMPSAVGETKPGAGMSSRSPLQPRPPQPIFAAYSSAPRPSSGPVAGTEPAHAMTVSSNPPKRKRGRPRKYAPDGTMPPTIIPTPYPTGAAASPTPVVYPRAPHWDCAWALGAPVRHQQCRRRYHHHL
ncbi:hypothetical protein ZWY2020_008695 [Hordeum vulgare]|nr:hypothetical protein ZWY2020_008695 [Hordeum vulgare]